VIGNPVLQFDQLSLQRKQGTKILHTRNGGRVSLAVDFANLFGQCRLGKFELIILIECIGEFSFKPILVCRFVL
jgi:hypothetical protein